MRTRSDPQRCFLFTTVLPGLLRSEKTPTPTVTFGGYVVIGKRSISPSWNSSITVLHAMALRKPDICEKMQRYLGQWARWLKFGLSAIAGFESDKPSFFVSSHVGAKERNLWGYAETHLSYFSSQNEHEILTMSGPLR